MEMCVHRLFIASLLVQLQAFGGSKSQSLGGSSPPVVSPTATANATSPTGLLRPRPRPRPRPPPPVLPSNPGTSLAPRPLLHGQCTVGAETAQTNSIVKFASADKLCVDVRRPAECSGVVARWEVCFGGHAAPMASTNLQIAVFRPGNSEMVYHLTSVSNLSLVPGEPEEAEAICQSHEATTEVMVEQGDLIGFVSGDGVRIALSTYNATGSLRVYNQNVQEGLLSSVGSLQLSQLQQLRQPVAPLIRIVLNTSTTNESSSMVPSPVTTITPCPPTEQTKRGRTLFTLICVITVAVVVIAILLAVVIVLACCICQDRCKLCKCCKLRTEVQPLEQTADQSMQYNDLYVPRNPTHIIRNGRRFTTQLHHNPAYGNPDHNAEQTVPEVQNHTDPHSDGQQIASSAPQTQDLTMNHNHSHREFDHIYESIK